MSNFEYYLYKVNISLKFKYKKSIVFLEMGAIFIYAYIPIGKLIFFEKCIGENNFTILQTSWLISNTLLLCYSLFKYVYIGTINKNTLSNYSFIYWIKINYLL